MMKTRGGHEMMRFLVYVTILVVLLVAVVILFTTLDAINRINDSAEREKNNVIDQLVDYLASSAEASAEIGMDPVASRYFSEELTSSFMQLNMAPVAEFLTAITRPLYGAEYVVFVIDGEVLGSTVEKNLDFDEFPTELPEEGDEGEEVQYEILEEFAGEEGFFLSFYRSFTMPGVDGFLNFTLDRSEQIEAIEQAYEDEKSDLITRQVIIGVVAVVVALLLSLLGVRYLARRYITGPIDELASVSHSIMEGTFEGEVQVEEGSDYADIQRLLQSGKVILDRACEVEEGEPEP